ncbi:dUTP diphosphatase [Oculatella sp. LEGE 06141]|uniref:dUTP diphosphatase n=1 Tax=Oculatella sp. LEGE 06141 TaxID=1828648 RepID=UPI0018817FC8|nr:dUTP diphosphatase [Oculatella sp. LEGE 06141]
MLVKIKRLTAEAKLPGYEHPGDAGADLVSVEDCTVQPMQWVAVPTGLAAEVPAGFELQVRPRSGLALRHGITVLNTPGTVDAGYRGEIKVILLNLSSTPFPISKGQRIAQLVVAPVMYGQFEEVDELAASQRGSGGFGSTGIAYSEVDGDRPQH